MNDTLGNTLVVEMKDFLTKVKILKERGTTGADAQRILIIGDRHTLLRRQGSNISTRRLMKLRSLSKRCGLAVFGWPRGNACGSLFRHVRSHLT